MKLLIHPAIDNYRFERITSSVGDSASVINAASDVESLSEIAAADAFIGKISRELLSKAHRLRWIQSPTASLEHYLFPELVRHPSILTNMRGIFSDVIADHVMGYVLCFARNLHHYIRRQVEGRWEPVGGERTPASYLEGSARESEIDRRTLHLSDQTLGIVGLGAIGREVARRAAAFGMRVLAVDERPEESSLRDGRPLPESLEETWPPERLDDLLAESDFVCITAPHTPSTFKLFSGDRFRRMKPGAYLINIGRGAIVDLDDLVFALEEGLLAGAALDVFETEPLPPDHGLWRMTNVILTPHVAGNSPRVPERHLEVLLENIRRFIAGESLLNVVDKERWC